METENMVIHPNEWQWGKSFMLVRENGMAIVGLSITDDEPEGGFIWGLSVAETIRRKGVGAKMLSDALEQAKEKGCKYASLQCNKDSFVFEWYKKVGFKYYGQKPNGNGFVTMYMELN